MPWDESYSVDVLLPKTLLVDPRIMLYTLDTIYPIKYIHFAGRRLQYYIIVYLHNIIVPHLLFMWVGRMGGVSF